VRFPSVNSLQSRNPHRTARPTRRKLALGLFWPESGASCFARSQQKISANFIAKPDLGPHGWRNTPKRALAAGYFDFSGGTKIWIGCANWGFGAGSGPENVRNGLYGGGWSLERTVLCIEFPANREKYREICEFRPRSLPAKFSMILNTSEFSLRNHEFLSSTEQGIITPVTGNSISLILVFRSVHEYSLAPCSHCLRRSRSNGPAIQVTHLGRDPTAFDAHADSGYNWVQQSIIFQKLQTDHSMTSATRVLGRSHSTIKLCRRTDWPMACSTGELCLSAFSANLASAGAFLVALRLQSYRTVTH
jgi:hypothetical protein